MNLLELAAAVPDKEAAVIFLQQHRIIHNIKLCDRNHPMTLEPKRARWRCFSRDCRQDLGVRVGTWLEGSRMDLRKVVLFIYCWSQEYTSVKFASLEVKFGKMAIIDFNNYMREVCATELLANQIKFGGPGTTVKIAESQFSRRKNNQGRQPPPQWVFGGICRKTGESWLESTLKISSVIGRTQRFETKTTWNAHTHGQLVFLWMNVATTTQRPPMPIRKNIRKHCSLLATMLKCHLLPFSSNLAIL